eukprot:scaffold136730_cov54-Attheya_sp.AAC.1
MLEFNIASGTSQVNPRPNHIELCKLIQAIDPEMAIESAINTTIWNSPNELPLAKEYQEHFNVQDRNPPYKSRKIVVHFTMRTKYRVNFHKHEPTVMKFLKANNMWLVLDKFQMQKVSRVGSMILKINLPVHRPNGLPTESIRPRRNNTTRVLYHTLYSKLPLRRTITVAIVTIKSALSHERG